MPNSVQEARERRIAAGVAAEALKRFGAEQIRERLAEPVGAELQEEASEIALEVELEAAGRQAARAKVAALEAARAHAAERKAARAIAVSVSVSGVKRTANMFANLEPIARKTILPRATAASVERLKQHIVRKIPVGPRGHKGDTGGWRRQQQRIPVASLPSRPGFTGSALPLPTRAALGVSEDDPVFYPYIVEFGSERITETVAPIRTAVNARGEREFIQMGKVIGTGLEGLAQAMAGGRLEKAKWWHLIRPHALPDDV